MNKNSGWKLGLSVAVVLVFVYGIIGIPSGFSRSALSDALVTGGPLRNGIHMGLDLKGGTHLILQVLVNDAVNSTSDRAVDLLKDEMTKRKINYADLSKPDPTNNPDLIVIKGVSADQRSELEGVVSDRLPEYDHKTGAENALTLTMKLQKLADLKSRAVEQAIETIRSRIDSLGVSEPIIQQHGLGQYQILVQLPGVDDPTRVKEIIKSTAMLEIKQVLGGPFTSETEALQQNGGMYPANSILMKYRGLGNSIDEDNRFYLVTRTSAVAGADLRPNGASVGRNSNTNTPEVQFSLTNEGGRKFGIFTRDHLKESLAVVLDNRVREVATINDEIHDQGTISGGGMKEENARDLALVLNSGALPAGLSYLEERTVGPSLGRDSISAGVNAALVGMIAVLVFMLIYYRGAGINADLALILNLIILLGFLGFTGATLTLPGIAGVILTVGMGVDSNVLIFERIREELRNGKTPPSAVEQGFGHAWITIVDTHVTTVVSALILFLFGTGPVKGFAVTLTFGLLANLFTAVFVSRMIFDWLLGRHQRGEALSILNQADGENPVSTYKQQKDRTALEFFRDANIDFLGKKWYFIAFSLIFSVAGVLSMLFWHGIPLGVDFRGGTLVYVKFAHTPDTNNIHEAMRKAGLPNARIQTYGAVSNNEVLIDLDIRETSEKALDQGKTQIISALESNAQPGKQDLNNASSLTIENHLLEKDPQHAGADANQRYAALTRAIVDQRDKVEGGVLLKFDDLKAVADAPVVASLQDSFYLSDFGVRNVEIVGPQVGDQLRGQALRATLYSLIGMLVYLGFRFEWIYGAAAVVTVLHDTLITVGAFSLTNKEISLTVIAAILTLIGYSNNDTIVIFDRIRENLKLMRREKLADVVNRSINQTLSRTILTAGLTFLTVLALYLFGGEVLRGFSFALVIGILIGTYSSIAIAAPILVAYQDWRDSKRPAVAATSGKNTPRQEKIKVKA